ncbi:hypothetical protein Bca4012_007284 [Brassica carinata]
MDLKAPCHEVGGVKFGDIHHVDIEQRLCGINLSVLSIGFVYHSRASHVNIVSLFEFFYERSKRAVIYEFMPNGSLNKFISNNISTKMEWNTLYNIAVGVPRRLDCLHNS